ncbi:methyltransferase [archaeon]|jgi:release factor glutamine methyltransferase|nr:methyltransferase [archaeon]
MSIYQPAEDSYLLQKELITFLKNKPKTIKILDMGTGSGIQAKTCIKQGFKNTTAADINPDAIKNLKKIKTIQSNLFSKIPKQKFDLIIFNPPYLPLDKREPKDSQLNTTAGKQGYEIILKFLKQSKPYLNKDATILLLFSSLSQPKIIKQKAKELNYSLTKLAEQSLFFEKLFVYQIKTKN